jgi:hypothetical protein
MMLGPEIDALLAVRITTERLSRAEQMLAWRRVRARRVHRLRWRGNTIEIHLSADMRQEQIDQVFASLARHLGRAA